MAVEYIGAKVFHDEVNDCGRVWVARNIYKTIHSMNFDQQGTSVPVWSSSQRASKYLQNADLIALSYMPHAVSVDVFIDEWLTDQEMAIAELQINPDGKSHQVLAIYPEEFQDNRELS